MNEPMPIKIKVRLHILSVGDVSLDHWYLFGECLKSSGSSNKCNIQVKIVRTDDETANDLWLLARVRGGRVILSILEEANQRAAYREH